MDAVGFTISIIQAAGTLMTVAERLKQFSDVPKDLKAKLDLLHTTSALLKDYFKAVQFQKECRTVVSLSCLSGTKTALDRALETVEDWHRAIARDSHAITSGDVAEENARKFIGSTSVPPPGHVSKGKPTGTSLFAQPVKNFAKSSLIIFSKAQWLIKGHELLDEELTNLERWKTTLIMALRLTPFAVSRTLQSNYLEFVRDVLVQHDKTKDVEIKPLKEFEGYTVRSLTLADAVGIGKSETDYESDIMVSRYCTNEAAVAEKREGAEQLVKLLTAIPEDRRTDEGIFRLTCIGYALRKRSNYRDDLDHALIFRAPSTYNRPRTLRDLLLDHPEGVSIGEKVQFAVSLTASLVVNHTLGLVHKTINPESIVVFQEMTNKEEEKFPMMIGKPCLLSFDDARTEKMASGKKSYENNFRRRVYCHPDHLRKQRFRNFAMRDDIYSLGVCLLEIGLWKSLFERPRSGGDDGLVLSDWAKHLDDYELRRAYDPDAEMSQVDRLRRVTLQDLAMQELTRVMGRKYANAVVDCLKNEPLPPRTESSGVVLAVVEETKVDEKCETEDARSAEEEEDTQIDEKSSEFSEESPHLLDEVPRAGKRASRGTLSLLSCGMRCNKKAIMSLFKRRGPIQEVVPPSSEKQDDSLLEEREKEGEGGEQPQEGTEVAKDADERDTDKSDDDISLLRSVLSDEGLHSLLFVRRVLLALEEICV